MEMYQWLVDNPTINRSELFRKAVVREQQLTSTKVPPLMFLMSVMGIVFSVALISIAVTPSPMHWIGKSILALLGGGLAVTTALVYYKVRKQLQVENS